MLTDNPLSNPFPPYSSNFEDFFNLDLLGSVHGSTPSGSSSSSKSPADSFIKLPPTPPQPMHMTTEEHDSLFSFSFDDDYLKTDPLANISAPFNFLNAIDSLSDSPTSISHGSRSQASTTAGSPAYLAIDPQLVGTPAPSKAQSELDDEDQDGDEQEEGDDEDDDISIAPLKVGGRGKSRKGTVLSGGVKKSVATSAREKKENQDREDADDWRPSPEEYAKMSSKEKRQLRNKISARNFRVRRKEYIHTLEGDIADRDRLIDAIRQELGSTKSENYALRQEVATLKKAILEGRASPMLPPPAPLSPISPVIRATSPLIMPNTNKDLPTSPRLGSRGFWGGTQTFGGITPVHTTIIPDFSINPILSGKPATPASAPPRRVFTPHLQENMNPSLNNVGLGLGFCSNPMEPSPFVKTPLTQAQQQQNALPHAASPGFDSFTEMNPFTLKTLDMYRMQLWGKMAVQNLQQREQFKANDNDNMGAAMGQQANALTGLAGNMRPHYFTSMMGKQQTSSVYPTPPTSPRSSASNLSTPSPQHAMVAALASQTLFQKMGAAFWDAFSGSSPASSSTGSSRSVVGWDSEKVRKVLEGKAVLRVVDIEPTKPATLPRSPMLLSKKLSSSSLPNSTSADALELSMQSLSLGSTTTSEKEDKCFRMFHCPTVALKK